MMDFWNYFETWIEFLIKKKRSYNLESFRIFIMKMGFWNYLKIVVNISLITTLSLYLFLTLPFLCLQKHDENMTALRQSFERQAKEIETKYEKKMRALRDELDLRRKTEIHEIEERKNGQINTLMKNHEKAFSDIKNYYNDITLNNLALINTLKVCLQFLI